MQNQFSFEYEFTEAFAARTADAYVHAHVKNVDRKFWTALVVLILWVTLCGLTLLLGILVDAPWWLWVIPAAFLAIFGSMLLVLLSLQLFVLLIRPFARWGTRRKMMAGYRDVADRTVRWTFADDQFAVRSAISSRQVPWQGLRQLCLSPEFWTLGPKNGPDLLLPVELLTPEVQGLICGKAREEGIPVILEETTAA
jgi:hypothetical protein